MSGDSIHRPRFSWWQRLRYRFDNALTRGISLILVWLAIITLAVLVLMAFVSWLWSAGPNDEAVPFSEAFWLTLTRTLDPGTFGADSGPRFRLLMLIVTLIGIFLVAVIIGLVSNAIDRRLESLRQGRSLVVETGHTLILGYGQKVPTIVRELAEANQSRRHAAVAILSDRTPSEVHDEIRAQGVDLHNTRLVVRRGNPASLDDLARMNAALARSIIVVAPEEDSADSIVVKNVLALKRFGVDFAQTPAIAEISDPSVALALSEIGGKGVLTLNPLATVARITARVLRVSGVGSIYEDVLDFQGDEIYTANVPPHLVGCRFGNLLLASSRSSVIGLVRGESVLPCADFETCVIDGDKVIAISADDSSLVLDRDNVNDHFDIEGEVSLQRDRETCLIVGWSRLGMAICEDNEKHVLPGSRVVVLLDPDLHDADRVRNEMNLTSQELIIVQGNPIHGATIDELLARHSFEHILVLAERDDLSYQEADARALLALLNIRKWYDAMPLESPRPNIVAELLDVNDEVIGEIARPDDFIVSERLVSLALAQLSENPHMYPVLRRLLDADGVQVQLLDVADLPVAQAKTFGDVVKACRSVGVIAIGCHRAGAGNGDPSSGTVELNPDKDAPLDLSTGDRIAVLMRT